MTTEFTIVKIGGDVVDDETALESALQTFATLPHPKVLVHGGGKVATSFGKRLDIIPTIIEGRRVTDRESLEVVTMIYGGLINKGIVARLYAMGCPSVGVTGADAGFIHAHKRPPTNGIDYGWVGDIDKVDTRFINTCVTNQLALVVAPLTHDMEGTLLNTNADTIASTIAVALAHQYNVTLSYAFAHDGVLRDVEDPASVITTLTHTEYQSLRANKNIHSGMIPKLDNAFAALEQGVHTVQICKYNDIDQTHNGTTLRR